MFDQSSFTTLTVVRVRNAVKESKDLYCRKLSPLCCGYVTGSGTVCKLLKPKPGVQLSVLGLGAVSLAAKLAGKISGCTKELSKSMLDSRLELAKELGATDVVNSKTEDPVSAVKKSLGGLGESWAVDTTGVKAELEEQFQMLAQGGLTATIAVLPHHKSV